MSLCFLSPHIRGGTANSEAYEAASPLFEIYYKSLKGSFSQTAQKCNKNQPQIIYPPKPHHFFRACVATASYFKNFDETDGTCRVVMQDFVDFLTYHTLVGMQRRQ